MTSAPKPSMKLRVGQQQIMTPQLLQSIRLLQLTTQELEQEVRDALDSNLMLEAEDGSGDEAQPTGEAAAVEAAQAEVETSERTDGEVSGCDAAATAKVEADYDWSSAESWSAGEPVDEDGEPFSARIAEPVQRDPRLQALTQLQLIVSDAREAELVAAIVDAINDNGYLSETLEAIAASLPGYVAPASLAEMEAALKLVQSVEPSGFGARDLRECLMLQLEALPVATRGRRLAKRIVESHLEALAGGNLEALAEELDVTVARLREARELIRGLDPRPGAAQLSETQAVVPEVTVSGRMGVWRVELNPETLPRVRINAMYERQLGNASASAYRTLRDQLNQARWLVRGLQMRHETLLKASRVIFERQSEFLRFGEEAMAPLTLRDVAEAIGMHESTVCRVVANKHALTPWGVYPLKAFFPVPIEGAEAGTSATAVRAMIRKIIDSESSEAPLCDGDVAALLARRGVRVARRTVAKYREAMRIAPATRRGSSLRSSAATS